MNKATVIARDIAYNALQLRLAKDLYHIIQTNADVWFCQAVYCVQSISIYLGMKKAILKKVCYYNVRFLVAC